MSKEPHSNSRLSCLAVINRRSGTVRSRGAEAVQALVTAALSEVFHPLEVRLVDGDVTDAIRSAIRDGKADVIVAGGGDGTISRAASLVVGTRVILGALPLGTMNLFVQALGFSALLEESLAQFRTAIPREIDVGIVNGTPFLHQVSFGLQPRLARLRERMGYRNRFTKMLAGARALLTLVMSPRPVRVNLELDAEELKVTSPIVVISNNLLGSTRNASLPERLDEGVLGIYVLNDLRLRTLLRLARAYLSRRDAADQAIDKRQARGLAVRRRPRRFSPFKKKRRALLSSIDGEVVLLRNPVAIEIKPKALRVLAAADGSAIPRLETAAA